MTPTIDLTAEQRRTVLALLNRHLPDTTVWACGSRVKWTSRPESDLDLVVFARPEQGAQVAELREALEESNLPFRVDLVVWDEVPGSFKKRIEGNHIVLASQNASRVIRDWRMMSFSNAILLNPTVSLERGNTYPFVDMATINVGTRCVYATQQRRYSGGGSSFRVGDTLMARITPCLENGKIARYCGFNASEFAHGSTEFIVIRGRPDVTDTEFAYYLTQWDKVHDYAIGQMTGTSGRQRVPTESLNHLTVPVPPIQEQHIIAHILGTLDDKIELNHRMNETLEAMARALFKSWFVDFDPVCAKMEGRDTGLPKPIADLFPDRMIQSELGLIPDGWEVLPLPQITEINPKRSLRKGEVAPYLDMANMPTRGHVPHAVVDRQFGSGMRFTNGDTLVARITPCLENGKTAYVDFLQHGEVGWGSTEYIVMRPMPPLPNEFAYYLARSTRFREFAIQNMTGTSGRQRVPAASLSKFSLPVPSKPIAESFGKFVRSLTIRASEAELESRTFAALRDSLLPKLISGEIRCRDAATQVESVA